MAFEHGRRVREHHRDRIAALDAALRKRGCKPATATVEVAIIAPQPPVDDRRTLRKHRGRALQEGERRQRLEIGRILVEVAVVRRHGLTLAFLPRTYRSATGRGSGRPFAARTWRARLG